MVVISRQRLPTESPRERCEALADRHASSNGHHHAHAVPLHVRHLLLHKLRAVLRHARLRDVVEGAAHVRGHAGEEHLVHRWIENACDRDAEAQDFETEEGALIEKIAL